MPELPEVETTRRSLVEHILGAKVGQVWLGKPLRWPLGVEPSCLVARTVVALDRRGKYLWLALQRGDGRRDGLLMHLGMSGSLAWWGHDAPARGVHDHFELGTDRGLLRLTDPRRFGAVVWSAALDAPPAADLLSRLGPEPFDAHLTHQSFHASLATHRTSIKALLLSGRVMVGAGNIYACEALFAAGIDPRCRADRISRPRAARLLLALRETLGRAIDAGGTTLRDYRAADGSQGAFQHEARVYGREAQPCLVCSTAVRRVVQGQRSTFFCPRCQRR